MFIAVSVIGLLVDVLGPVVLLVSIGAATGRRLDIDAVTLSKLAYWVFGPAFVFELFVSSELAGGTIVRLAFAGLAGMLAAGVVAFGVGALADLPARIRAAGVMTSAYGNVGNAGLAISAFALGDDALAAAAVLMLVINVSGVMLGIGLATAQSTGILKAIRRALSAPMTLATIPAILLNALNADVPLVIDRTVGLLGAALIPVLLYTLGVQFGQTGWTRPRIDFAISAGAKLVIAPVIALFAAIALGLSGDERAVVVIQSAMPPAVFTMVVAMEHDLEPERVTANLVNMTLLSLLTLPVVLALVVP